MMWLLLLSILIQQYSIHQVEYYDNFDPDKIEQISTFPQDHIPRQSAISGMVKDYYGYCPYWIDTVYYAYFQMDLLTHLAYFSVEIDPATGELGGIPYIERFAKIRDHAHGHGVAVHMTFIIFGNSSVASFLNNASARDQAIIQMCDFVANYGIEGVNIDFEFVTSTVRDSFNLFIADLAYAMWNHTGGRKDLYIAMPAVPEWYPGYDYAHLSDYSDGLFIMAYGFHYSGSSVAGPVSPCVPSTFWGQYCCALSIGSYLAYGADRTKVILGIPYYGYDWPTETGDMGSNTTGSGTARIYYYAFQGALTHGRIWDDHSLTPWYRYYTSEWHQCWYDDSASCDVKFGIVNDSLIAGAGCWALGYDRSYDHLWNMVRKHFWDSLEVIEYTVLEEGFRGSRGVIFIDEFIIDNLCAASNYRIAIYDIAGRLRRLFDINNARSLSVGHGLEPGVYFIMLANAATTRCIKVIKIN